MYKVRYYEQTLIEVKNMKDKYEKKNKLSPEVKSSIIVIVTKRCRGNPRCVCWNSR